MDVSIRRSNKAKRVAIRVTSEGKVELVLPKRVSEQVGMAFLRDRVDWIMTMLKKQEKARSALEPVLLQNGATVPCFGDALDLDIQVDSSRTRSSVRNVGNTLIVSVPDEQKALSAITAFYISEAKQYFALQSEEFGKVVNRDIKKIRAIDMKTQWGSCNSGTQTLTFNWRLALAPEHIARYVAAHEVAHLVHPNHSNTFWKVVAKLDPSYATSRAWLRTYGAGLSLQQKLSRS